MIQYMPILNYDECLYSLISRYKVHTKRSYKDVIYDFWNLPQFSLSIGAPSLLATVANSIPIDYITGHYLLQHCTLIPYYSFFLKEQEINLINNTALFKRVDFFEQKLIKPHSDSNYVKYCPICAKEELNTDGESYIHRMHQIESIYICERHDCKLYKYEYQLLSKSDLVYLKPEYMNFDVYYYPTKLTQLFRHCANEANQILNSHIRLDKDIKMCYKNKMHELNYSKVKSDYFDIMKHNRKFNFDNDVLNQENIILEDLLPWVPDLFNKSNRNVRPMQHILMIYFLYNSIQNLLHSE